MFSSAPYTLYYLPGDSKEFQHEIDFPSGPNRNYTSLDAYFEESNRRRKLY